MAKSSIDRDFERFVAHADMDALGDVFDRTAPALYRIAFHLRPCSASAEDLVQMTFVTAIHKAAHFDPGRRVFPWLLGILTIHARELHRRDRYVSLQADELDEATPLDSVEDRETRACIEDAIRGLPELYREVVRRYLEDGIAPREISHQLSRPPGTVRSQLRRGLEHLRRGLPSGLTSALAVIDMPERGLHEVRARVLEHARGAVGTASASAAPLALPLVILVLLVVSGVTALMTAEGPEPTPVMSPAVATSATSHADRSVATTVGHGGARWPLAPVRLAPEPWAELSGRAVDGVSGIPLRGLPVEVLDLQQHIRALVRQEPAGEPLDSGKTDAEGRFCLRFPAVERSLGYRMRIAVGEAGLVTENMDWDYFAPGERVDLGDVAVRHGARCVGRLVTPAGVPVAEATLRIASPRPVYANVVQGEFRTPVLPDGRWRLSASQSGLEILSPHSIDVRGPAPTRALVTVAERPSISGLVIDSAGAPVPEVTVRSTAGDSGFAISDEAGRFHLYCRSRATTGREVTLEATGHSIRAAAPVRARWNGPEVRVSVHRHPRIPVRVVDADGRPVTAFWARCVPAVEDGGVVREKVARPVGGRRPTVTRDRDGRAEVLSSGVGWNVVHVQPESPEWLPSEPVPVFVETGRRSLVTVRLTESPRLRVTVRSDSGAVVPGARVELSGSPVDGGPRGLQPSVPQVAATGADGVAELRRCLAAPVTLSISCAGYADVRRVLRDSPRDLSVTLARPGTLAGRFSTTTCAKRIELHPLAGNSRPDVLLVGTGGTFRGEGLAPGAYEVVGLYGVRRTVVGAHDSRFVAFDAPLAAIEIRAGERTELIIDAQLASAGAMHGRVTLSGTSPDESWIYLTRIATGGQFEQGPFTVHSDGRFQVAGLAPGRYRARWSSAGARVRPTRISIDVPGEVTVVGGRSTVFESDLRCGGLDVTVLGSDSLPLAEQDVDIQWRGATARIRTDAEGRLQGHLVPVGPARIRLAGAGSAAECPMEDESGRRRRTIKLPARRVED